MPEQELQLEKCLCILNDWEATFSKEDHLFLWCEQNGLTANSIRLRYEVSDKVDYAALEKLDYP